jgi:hypothetical protein
MNELKPCPFCGTIPEIQICDRDGMIYPGSDYEENQWNGSGYRLVRTTGYPFKYAVIGSDIYDTSESAEEAWNKMAQKVNAMEKNLDLIIAIPSEASQTDRIGADIIMVWPPFTLYIHTLGKCMYLCLDPNRSSMIHTGDIASKGLLVQVGPCDPRAR